MKKKSHIILGLVLGFAFVLLLGWLNLDWFEFTLGSSAVIVCVMVFYSLLPDIDHKNSTITWWFFGIGMLGLVFGILGLALKMEAYSPMKLIISSAILLAATFVSVNVFEHRGFTHSIPAGIIAALPIYLLFHHFFYCVMAYVAWHSHLIGDGYLLKWK